MSGSTTTYGPLEVERFVEYLGCWSSTYTPDQAMEMRTAKEYKALLKRLIEVNKTRQDEIGMMETAAARRYLLRLRSVK